MRSCDSSNDEGNNLDVFIHEKEARQRVVCDNHVDLLVDVFSKGTTHYMIVQ